MLPVFLRSFANALMIYFASEKAGSEITENGLLRGSERRKRSIVGVSQMNFTGKHNGYGLFVFIGRALSVISFIISLSTRAVIGQFSGPYSPVQAAKI